MVGRLKRFEVSHFTNPVSSSTRLDASPLFKSSSESSPESQITGKKRKGEPVIPKPLKRATKQPAMLPAQYKTKEEAASAFFHSTPPFNFRSKFEVFRRCAILMLL